MEICLKALSANQIEAVHDLSLKLMEEHGLEMKCPQALETFSRHGAKVSGSRVFLPPDMVQRAVDSAPAAFKVLAPNPDKDVTIGGGAPTAVTPSAGAPFLTDARSRQRMANFDDFKDMLRLTQTSPALDFSSSVALSAEHPHPDEGSYLQQYYTLAMTDLPLVGLSQDQAVAEKGIDMARQAVGREGAPVCVGVSNSLSPMAWDERMLGVIRAYATKGQAVNISCCSMAGATAPVNLYGVIVQSNAEVLAGLVYAQLLSPGAPVIYGTTSSIMDMQSMGLSLGTPEYSLISTACGQMAARYRVPYRGGGGLTDAKVFDAQAGMESAVNLLVSLNNGVDFMLQGLGILEAFMSVSFEKWVMDEEIIRRVRHMQKGLGEMPGNLAEIIPSGIKAGNYLGLPNTLKGFRKEMYWPKLADRRNFEAWKSQGRDFLKSAQELVAKRLADYVPPPMEPERAEALRRAAEDCLGYAPPEA